MGIDQIYHINEKDTHFSVFHLLFGLIEKPIFLTTLIKGKILFD
jgi:hypothetical protein